jgi:type IV pilus assembly protein PilB
MVGEKKKVGEILIALGKISHVELNDALLVQKETGKKLGDILIEKKLISAEELIDVLESQLNVEKVELDTIMVEEEVVKIVPESICIKHQLFPFYMDETTIKIAMVDPLNIFAIDDVNIITGLKVLVYISPKNEIARAIDRYYSNRKVIDAAKELSKEVASEEEDSKTNSIDDIKNSPTVKMIDNIIKSAIESRASDIHIEPFEKIVKIRFRIDGQLATISTIAKESSQALVARIKILANLNIAEKRVPQDGRILTSIGNKSIDLRVSILPTISGEKVVIRILSKDESIKTKQNLGMNEYEINQLNEILRSPHGIILVTGPTGSGKSTTLYTVLSELNKDSKNIITIEDPVEFTVEGVNQVNVNNKAGMTFASGLRSILRQDPDIIMIGEIRDSETAQIAVRAAITGHLVLSTIHTNDAPSTIFRLADMEVEPYLIASSISGVISQRLVRRICPKCKKAYEASNYQKMILGCSPNDNITLYKGEGCVHCNNSGYSGRMGTYEIMTINKEMRQAIVDTKDNELIKEIAIKNGMKTLKEAASKLVLDGTTTIEEMIGIADVN